MHLTPDIKKRMMMSLLVSILAFAVLPIALMFTSHKTVTPNIPIEASLPDLTLQAESGDAKAQMDLANKYFMGLGVEKDYLTARMWAQRSFDRGNEKDAKEILDIIDLFEESQVEPEQFKNDTAPVAIPSGLPKYNVGAQCNKTVVVKNYVSPSLLSNCLQNQQQQYNGLKTNWTSFPQAIKDHCVQSLSEDGMQSYFLLSNCIRYQLKSQGELAKFKFDY